LQVYVCHDVGGMFAAPARSSYRTRGREAELARDITDVVAPAKAGPRATTESPAVWIPAFARFRGNDEGNRFEYGEVRTHAISLINGIKIR
jgi:hypothetical protein